MAANLERNDTMVDTATKTTTWTIDPHHSSIGFAVKHMMFATVRGRFDDFAGTFQFDPDHVERSSVEVTIQTATVDTGIGPRDADLRSAKFFDVEQFPTATFHSTRVEGDGERFVIHGELTIKGFTRPIRLKAEFQGRGVNPAGVEVAGFEARGKLNRKDFGLSWNQALESGGVLVGDEVALTIDVQAGAIDS
jgi:polyisoprenoid-binding protein YceI